MNYMISYFLLLTPVLGIGQTVGSYNIGQDTTVKYIKVRLIDTGKDKYKVFFEAWVDYGKVPEAEVNYRITDKENKNMLFRTEMQMLHYLDGLGWDFMYEKDPFSFVFRRGSQ